MLSINRNKTGWALYEHATDQDAATLNSAANTAVLDVLKEMQVEGVVMEAALNTALARARATFYNVQKVGAYDTEPLAILEHEVTRQFLVNRG
jgi:hypothetical protein